MMRNS